jgi:hypothetical protein
MMKTLSTGACSFFLLHNDDIEYIIALQDPWQMLGLCHTSHRCRECFVKVLQWKFFGATIEDFYKMPVYYTTRWGYSYCPPFGLPPQLDVPLEEMFNLNLRKQFMRAVINNRVNYVRLLTTYFMDSIDMLTVVDTLTTVRNEKKTECTDSMHYLITHYVMI